MSAIAVSRRHANWVIDIAAAASDREPRTLHGEIVSRGAHAGR
jgi:hypothetical protein